MRKVAKKIVECTNEILSNKGAPANVDQRHLNSILTAVTIAYRLPLPSGPVNRPEEWFLINCLVGYEDVVGQLNEHLVLNVAEVDKLLRTTWLLRYRILHAPYSVQALSALMCAVGESEYEVAEVYRSWIHGPGANSATHAMRKVGHCMNECNVLSVELSDE